MFRLELSSSDSDSDDGRRGSKRDRKRDRSCPYAHALSGKNHDRRLCARLLLTIFGGMLGAYMRDVGTGAGSTRSTRNVIRIVSANVTMSASVSGTIWNKQMNAIGNPPGPAALRFDPRGAIYW